MSWNHGFNLSKPSIKQYLKGLLQQLAESSGDESILREIIVCVNLIWRKSDAGPQELGKKRSQRCPMGPKIEQIQYHLKFSISPENFNLA